MSLTEQDKLLAHIHAIIDWLIDECDDRGQSRECELGQARHIETLIEGATVQ